MNVAEMSLEEIRQRGLKALARELGPVGLVRFLQQFETGHGDYSRDRRNWLSDDLPSVLEEIRREQQRSDVDQESGQ